MAVSLEVLGTLLQNCLESDTPQAPNFYTDGEIQRQSGSEPWQRVYEVAMLEWLKVRENVFITLFMGKLSFCQTLLEGLINGL